MRHSSPIFLCLKKKKICMRQRSKCNGQKYHKMLILTHQVIGPRMLKKRPNTMKEHWCKRPKPEPKHATLNIQSPLKRWFMLCCGLSLSVVPGILRSSTLGYWNLCVLFIFFAIINSLLPYAITQFGGGGCQLSFLQLADAIFISLTFVNF